MIIYTHPDNIRLVTKDLVNEKMYDGEQFFSGEIKVITSRDMPRTRISGYKPKNERFVEYGVSDWTIYCGFVEPVYEPLFYLYEERRSTVFNLKRFGYELVKGLE